MSEYRWTACGIKQLRLELFGEVELVGETFQLVSAAGIRVRNHSGAGESARIDDVVHIDIEEIHMENPIPLEKIPGIEEPSPDSGSTEETIADQALYYIKSIPVEKLILEGMERPIGRFLDIVAISGWNLVFEQAVGSNTIDFGLHLLSDWEFDTHPDYFPGTTLGEVTIIGKFGDDDSVKHPEMTIDMPWPFAVQGRLPVKDPIREDNVWNSILDLTEITSIFDGAGFALKDFPLGNLDFKNLFKKLKEKLGTAMETIRDYCRLESGIDENGNIFFALVVRMPDKIQIAEFGGLRVVPSNNSKFKLIGTLTASHIELEFRLILDTNCYIELSGPLVRKVTGAAETAREIISFLPPGTGSFDIPEINLKFEIPIGGNTGNNEPKIISLAKVSLPVRWDVTPISSAISNIFQDLSLNIDAGKLKGYRLGILKGDTPRVELEITDVKSSQANGAYILEFYITLRVEAASMEKPFELKGTWDFTFDLATLSFIPGETIHFASSGVDFQASGLEVKGLKSLAVSWESAGLTFSTSDGLAAYYKGISDENDSSNGFEFRLNNLKIGAGGVDMHLTASGGAPKIAGIGEPFKGVNGEILIVGSRVQRASLTAEGSLPWLDNATGKITLVFKEGLKLKEVNSEFQLGIHHRTDWWLELDLKKLRIDIEFNNNKPLLLIMITGKVGIKPQAGGAGNFLLRYLSAIELEFENLVLTKAFDSIPPHISLLVVLSRPFNVNLFDVFGFEIRSIRVGSGDRPGTAALSIGGQIFFGSQDLQDTRPDFHILKILEPDPGSFLPRIVLKNLGLRFAYKPSIEIDGFVDFFDEPDREGFRGGAKMIANSNLGFNVLVEIAKVKRQQDGKMLRVWMLYAELLNLNQSLIYGFFLRDVGVGFGWRKTLHVMDNPNMILEDPSKSTFTIAPHLPTSWVDYLAGDEPVWTLVIAGWFTYGCSSRDAVSPLVGDIIIGLRSDLTFIAADRAWVFASLDGVKGSARSTRPAMAGFISLSMRTRHLLASHVVDPTAVAPEGLPVPLEKSLSISPFNFTLEITPGFSRAELGWPNQLSFPLGISTGRAGLIVRATGSSLAICLNFENRMEFSWERNFNLGKGKVAVIVYGVIAAWGSVMVCIGLKPAVYGQVGINAFVDIRLILQVNYKIRRFVRIRFSMRTRMSLVFTARVEFGISDRGFGVKGSARAGLRIWKFSFSAPIAIIINKTALDEARKRVSAGTNAGETTPVNAGTFELPPGTGPIPEPRPLNPKWKVVSAGQGDFIYILLLPEDDAWFAEPHPNDSPEIPAGSDPAQYERPENEKWLISDIPDYEIVFNVQGVELVGTPAPGGGSAQAGPELRFHHRCDWNAVTTVTTVDESGKEARQSVSHGDWYYEQEPVKMELRRIAAILGKPGYRPELLADWRVRAEKDAGENTASSGIRPDVRSPNFAADGGLYETALEEAFGYDEDDSFSWRQIAVAKTRWTEEIMDNPAVLEFLVGKENLDDFNNKTPGEKRKILLKNIEHLGEKRCSLITRLFEEFRHWTGEDPVNPDDPATGLELLGLSGLAFKFKVTGQDWSIDLKSLQVNEGYGNSYTLTADGISQAHVTGDTPGPGFSARGYCYNLRDLVEFQDKDGIHFSWQMECLDQDNNSHILTDEQAAGLAPQDDYFEYFDHYSVERINYSTRDDAKRMVRWEIKPAFVPALVDLGKEEKSFFLLVSRFDFSDLFQEPADVGDFLVYRFTAIDVFGNRSRTIEYAATRKQFQLPPPPDKGHILYEAVLTDQAVVSEQLTVSVRPAVEMTHWTGSPVRYEVWARSFSIAAGGYFGLGDDAGETSRAGDREPVIDPRGMTLIGVTTGENIAPAETDLERLGYGKVHEFYVRAVTSEGNASRLVRCEHISRISSPASQDAAKERQLPFIERIPPPSESASQWVSIEEMRAEARHAREPRPDPGQDNKIGAVDVADATQREATLRILHRNYTDESYRHPTGGYEIFARDRDAAVEDIPANYKRVAQVEVIGENIFRGLPQKTEPWHRWHARYLAADEEPASSKPAETDDAVDRGYLDWGEVIVNSDGARIDNFPAGVSLHARLDELLLALQQKGAGSSYRLQINGGPPTGREIADTSFKSLAEDHTGEKDPYLSGLLKRMGRSVDFTLTHEKGTIEPGELYAMLESIINDLHTATGKKVYNRYRVMLEILVNGDRSTRMNYYRLSYHPRILPLPENADKTKEEEERKACRLSAFKGFGDALEKAGISTAGILDPGAFDKYEKFIRRFLLQRPIDESNLLTIGVVYYEESGSFSRPLNSDDTIKVQLYYREAYARRLAYRVRRVSRYLPLYRQLGLSTPGQGGAFKPGDSLMVRFPRVVHPKPPVVQFIGNFDREGIIHSEWLLREHDEEALVQANETLRNRLGYRGMAWSLFVEAISTWHAWSGWKGENTWENRPEQVTDGGVPGFSPVEKARLNADAARSGPALHLPPAAGLAGHPFTGLLEPKGMVIRIPRLPYYYLYRVGAFARADDVDSNVSIADAGRTLPLKTPAINPATAGWTIDDKDKLSIWWRIPSVWESLEEQEQALWANEEPYARRLWDFDLKYTLRIRRQAVLIPLVSIVCINLAGLKPGEDIPKQGSFSATTAASYLYDKNEGQVETLKEILIASPFKPEILLELNISRNLRNWISIEDDFVFELQCFRNYGKGDPTIARLPRSKNKEEVS